MLLNLFTRRQSREAPPTFHPRLECLEDRQVPTVTYHGGALLPHVEVQALYYGNDWFNHIATDYKMTGQLNGFLRNVTGGSYMDMLYWAGYNVGRGNFEKSYISLTPIDKRKVLDDGVIQQELQREIHAGNLGSPDGNRLNVVYVEDNVVVRKGAMTTQNGFGYHSVFQGTQADGYHSAIIRYAVVAYPGGPNASLPGVSVFDTMTAATSHELAESVTNPDGALAKSAQDPVQGWVDTNLIPNTGLEIADLAQGRLVYLNGYCVQRIANPNDLPMTPAGATASRDVNFVLSNGNVYLYPSGDAGQLLAAGIAKISDQGIDNDGHAMIDLITPNGHAVEYHDVSGRWTDLGWGVTDARAGQGVSYVLLANGGRVSQFDDASGKWKVVTNSATMIDAGTDQYGINSVDFVFVDRVGIISDNYFDRARYMGAFYAGVKSISAGQRGDSVIVDLNGNAYFWNETRGSWAGQFATNVVQMTIGTDPNGQSQIDEFLTNGLAWEYRASTGKWTLLFAGNPGTYEIESISKARAGVINLILHNYIFHTAFEQVEPGRWYLLTEPASAVG
jgi:hypothetical protein